MKGSGSADIARMAVAIAERVCDLAVPGAVLVRRRVSDHLLGPDVEFEGRGERELRGRRQRAAPLRLRFAVPRRPDHAASAVIPR
jgi:class 3 adenylate cyclase